MALTGTCYYALLMFVNNWEMPVFSISAYPAKKLFGSQFVFVLRLFAEVSHTFITFSNI
jgi:hypothetical protein